MVLIKYWLDTNKKNDNNINLFFKEESPFFELRAQEEFLIDFQDGIHKLKTGLRIEVPENHVLVVLPNFEKAVLIHGDISGVYKTGIHDLFIYLYSVDSNGIVNEGDLLGYGYVQEVKELTWELQESK